MIKQLREFINELVRMDCADFMPSSTQGSIIVYWKPKELTRTQIDEVLAYWRGDHLPPDPHQEEARRIRESSVGGRFPLAFITT